MHIFIYILKFYVELSVFTVSRLLVLAHHHDGPTLVLRAPRHRGGHACRARCPGFCVTTVLRVYCTPLTPGLPVHQSNFMSNILIYQGSSLHI